MNQINAALEIPFMSSRPRFKNTSRPKSQEQSCDDAVISVISRWKRLLGSEIKDASNKSISTLFNAIMFVRGCEDRNLERSLQRRDDLFIKLLRDSSDIVNAGELIKAAFINTGVAGNIDDYIDFGQIGVFSTLDKGTANSLLRDFYSPKDAPYSLNFALMSKHALSRIYERFVTILVDDDQNSNQLSFLPAPLVEKLPQKTGAIYTPQFIASFFARYIKDNSTPKKFRELRSLDPACGSGIFLRTVLEEQCNPADSAISSDTISKMFANARGIDKDGNAIEATRLSLALLHLVSTDKLPSNLNVQEANSIELAQNGGVELDFFDAVLTNPPYIKLDHLDAETRDTYSEYLGSEFVGRLDAYIAFMKLCLDAVALNGLACFVIPQTFLQAKNAEMVRRRIARDFDVRCLIDLSAVDVFEGVGAYSILLIVERRAVVSDASVAFVAQATEFVGSALQAVLDSREVSEPYFRVFKADQSLFSGTTWTIRPPEVFEFDKRLREYPKISEFLDCFQGFVTGADDVFIRRRTDIPNEERRIYMDFLADRRIARYAVPSSTDEVVFYPYMGQELITEDQLIELFPKTWEYLAVNKARLESRRRSSSTPWWKPERPRSPARMKGPKIVAPHLMLTPRFAVDFKGRFATKHGPILAPKVEGDESLALSFFTAVLNSSFGGWYIRTHVPVFSRGYSRLEPATLKEIPVPDLHQVEFRVLQKIADLVKIAGESSAASSEIDRIILDLYNFRKEELLLLGASI